MNSLPFSGVCAYCYWQGYVGRNYRNPNDIVCFKCMCRGEPSRLQHALAWGKEQAYRLQEKLSYSNQISKEATSNWEKQLVRNFPQAPRVAIEFDIYEKYPRSFVFEGAKLWIERQGVKRRFQNESLETRARAALLCLEITRILLAWRKGQPIPSKEKREGPIELPALAMDEDAVQFRKFEIDLHELRTVYDEAFSKAAAVIGDDLVDEDPSR